MFYNTGYRQICYEGKFQITRTLNGMGDYTKMCVDLTQNLEITEE